MFLVAGNFLTKVYICEKPSLAQALAGNLGTPLRKDGYFQVNNDFVCWLRGHIIELLEPDDYKEEWSRFKCTYETLPMFPEVFKKRIKKGDYKKIYDTVKLLCSKADVVVNVGDPDREGQYLVDEVLDEVGWKGKTERLFINAYDDVTIKRALTLIENNNSAKNHNMYRSAFCRDITDWLIGMNGSRKFTLDAGYQVSVGRVQVPILGLVYRRNQEIDKFKPVKFYKVKASHNVSDVVFTSEWLPAEDYRPEAFDSEGRLLEKKVADIVAAEIKGCEGVVKSIEVENKKVPQPLPYSLATLQKDACKRLGISLKELDVILQKLYESYKILTYPRSDCEYIPESQFNDARIILDLLSGLNVGISNYAASADFSIKSRAFNDKKISAHHAIIPTSVVPPLDKMSVAEKGVYLIVALRYISQFYKVNEYSLTKCFIDCNGKVFVASGSVVKELGWKALIKKDDEQDTENEEDKCLPLLEEGQKILFLDSVVTEGITKPPARFTQESLITALCNAYKYVRNKDLRDVVKEIKGLGTPATRSVIIGKLLDRGTLIEKVKAEGKKKKKELYTAPEVGGFIDSLPADFTYPDNTALIELNLDRVASGTMTEEEYKSNMYSYINDLMKVKCSFSPRKQKESSEHPQCPSCNLGILYKHKSEYGVFWSCSRYKEGCNAKFSDLNGKPAIFKCPQCGRLLKKVKSQKTGKLFWSCTGYFTGDCKVIFADDNGKPAKPLPVYKCPQCGDELRRVSTRNGFFWVCRSYGKTCNAKWFLDRNSKPVIEKCPSCKGYMVQLKGPKGLFFGCVNYPNCKETMQADEKGFPIVKRLKK